MTSRLSSMLVQDGRVTAKKMADAFQRQVIFGGTLDTILLEMGLVEPAVLSEYLARATGLQFTADLPSPEVVAVVQEGFSAALVERFHAVPLGRGPSGKLRVMVVDVPDREDPAALGQEIGRQLEVVVAPEYRFQQALEILYGVRLLPRFAKIAGKIENPAGPGAAPAATPSGPSLFAGRKPQARPGIESTPTPASRQPAAAPGAPAPNAASGMQRNSPTPAPVATATPSLVSGGQVTPAPVATPGPSLIPGGRQMTPAPVATARPGSAGAPPDDRGRPSLFDRAGSASRSRTPAPLAAGGAVVDSTVRGLAPFGGGLVPQPGTFDFSGGPATLEDFVVPGAGARSQPLSDGEVPEPDVEPVIDALSLEDGIAVLQSATDRDAVLETLCRVARGYFQFAAIFVVQGESASLSMALGTAFFDRTSLRGAAVDLGSPSPLRTAVQSLSPYIGTLGDEDVLGETLAFLGRHVPTAGALLPIVLRGRCVAMLHVDDGGREVSADELADLVHAASETAIAFLRIIQAQKMGAPNAPAPQVKSGPAANRGAKSGARGAVPARVGPQSSGAVPARVGPQPSGAVPARVGAQPSGAVPARVGAQPSGAVPARVGAQPSGAVRAAVTSTIPGPGPVAPAAAASPRPPRVSDLPAPVDGAEVQRLLQVVEDDDPVAGPAAAAALAASPGAAAAAVAQRFPGLLRFAYRKPHAIGLSLAEHGPLLALAGRLGMPMVGPIIQRLSDGSADHRFYAALVLAELRSDEAVVPLGLRLFDADPAVRRAAAYALSRQPPSPTLGRLLDQLRDELGSPDMDRQRAAAAAAGELRDVTGVPKLIDLLTHRDMEVVDLARRALVVITKQDFGTARWRWRSWWEKARVQSRAEWLLNGLEQPSPEARRSSIDELCVITTDRLGCHARLSRREREEAQRRFSEWLAQHPDALEDDKLA